MIRPCTTQDFDQIHEIINDGARAYRGNIPVDRLRDPYMSREELQHEIDAGVTFWGHETDGQFTGVMDTQDVDDPFEDSPRQSYPSCLRANQRAGTGNRRSFSRISAR